MRRDEIIAVATGIFSRFGYAKTTLVEIARRSAISRPTLYAEFADKDELFSAVITGMANAMLETIDTELAKIDGLRPRLKCACSLWVRSGYDLVRENPEAADLFDPRFSAVLESNKRFETLLAQLVADTKPAADSALSVDRIAETMTLATQGIKRFATDVEHLDALLDTLVAVVCVALDE